MTDPKSIEFFGQTFSLKDSISTIRLYEFAAADIEDGRESMGAQFRLLQACIVADDWDRFVKAADKNRAEPADFLPIFKTMFEAATERPTGLPADSSDGQLPTQLKPVLNSEGKGSGRFAGRPDLQTAIERTKAS